jgi:cytidine deaminase
VNVISHEELIASAQSVLNPRRINGYRPGGRGWQIGQVAASLVTDRGSLYSGVCIDTGSGIGFCAEHAAIGAMVTAREYRIAKIVAVWRSDEGVLHVLPPCGRCREFMRQIDPANLDAEVVLGRTTSAPLRDLLPYHEWPSPLD